MQYVQYEGCKTAANGKHAMQDTPDAVCHHCGMMRSEIMHLSERIGGGFVNHPPHYTRHPSGIECIQVTRHMNFNIGNAVKYLWRCDEKGDAIENLEKAIWYIKDEIQRRFSRGDAPYQFCEEKPPTALYDYGDRDHLSCEPGQTSQSVQDHPPIGGNDDIPGVLPTTR